MNKETLLASHEFPTLPILFLPPERSPGKNKRIYLHSAVKKAAEGLTDTANWMTQVLTEVNMSL